MTFGPFSIMISNRGCGFALVLLGLVAQIFDEWACRKAKDQLGDLFTKPLGLELFYKFTSRIFGWTNPSVMEKLGNDLDTS